ncbi:dephospho-CoA kinase [Timonella sp. A28]|uniref:dephospho-CoA kinase n=1 Tax=Timonella sp. A28 TaxID=3442640 RepID=UPI003EBC04CB
MFRVGLTGGIASGKSEVSRLLRALQVNVIDHDVLARQAVAPGSAGLRRIADHFGAQVLTKHGELDRTALAHLVFGNKDELHVLNTIVHPEVKRLADENDQAARDAGAAIVVHDIPLLVETQQEDTFDAVLVVEAPMAHRIERMKQYRGMSEEEAQSRIAQQASDEQRRTAADFVIMNDGNLSDLETRVHDTWNKVLKRKTRQRSL